MAYSELIKNFNRIRDYMREFYLYGFKNREEYTKKSARSYDDERRRLESWLGDAMRFRRTPEGKNVFISVDTRVSRHNPLYAAWKAKSFTDGDITLHFLLFDILHDPETALPLHRIAEAIADRLADFGQAKTFDESTIRKKLKEYEAEGIISAERRGKTVLYRRSAAQAAPDPDILDFFSEAAPCGVVGSFLLDKVPRHEEHFTFKHHYISSAMDSGIVCALLLAMGEKRYVTMECLHRDGGRITEKRAVPLRLMISVRSGRQYLMAWTPARRRISSFRTDSILSVRADEVCETFDALRETLDGMMPHLWGVSTQGRSGGRMEHIAFTVRYGKNEAFIPERLMREKRCGTVERPEEGVCRFSADVYDAGELMPWIRTFICRITHFESSDPALEAQFREDLRQMYALYGMEGGEDG